MRKENSKKRYEIQRLYIAGFIFNKLKREKIIYFQDFLYLKIN